MLCDLEGMSYRAAAERLGCPIGTVSVRLMRARERLRTRLVRRGESVASVEGINRLAADTDQQPVAPALIVAATRHAAALAAGRLPGTGAIPSTISNLVRGVTRTMFVTQFTARAFASLILGAAPGLGVPRLPGRREGFSSRDQRHAAARHRSHAREGERGGGG